jgi:iron complex transport system ATP-binding protein
MDGKTIEIKNVEIGYRAKKTVKIVARNLQATIFPGELTCLLGANGVGKSTLLRTLAGFQPKLSGEIRIHGQSIDACSNKVLSRIIGVVLTEKADVRDMTATELISLGRSPYTGFFGKLNQADEHLVQKAISMIKIEDLANRPVQTLSDGERQKVMIAKVLAQETPIVYLDEPTAFLDFPSKVEIMRLLLRLSRQTGKTIFLSTHDVELALQIADKLWLMDKETGLRVGSPEELKKDGSIGRFFQCEDVTFDSESGIFRIDKQVL